jgi:hypothetical protein
MADLALEGVLVGVAVAGDDRLADHRHGLYHTARPELGGHIAPADQGRPSTGMLEGLGGGVAGLRAAGSTWPLHSGRAAAGHRGCAPSAQQGVGGLDHAARAVAHQRIGADGAAMVEIDQDLQALAHDGVRFPPLDVGHEADAAGIVFVAWVVQSLLLRQCHDSTLLAR